MARMNTPCMILRSAPDNGYSRVWGSGRNLYAHRVAWEERHGPVSPGLVVGHLCRVRSCINPDHLVVDTQRKNISRALTQLECARGHSLTEANSLRHADGTRQCRECHRDRQREYRARVALKEMMPPTPRIL